MSEEAAVGGKRSERIIVVDDAKEMIPMFETLSAPDFNMILARKPSTALEWLGIFDYDVDAVVTDLAMSPINGWQFTEMIREQEAIRSHHSPIKIFWMTAYPITDTILERRQQLGVVKIFRKPEDDPITIVNTVRSCVECPAKYYAEDPRPKDELDA